MRRGRIVAVVVGLAVLAAVAGGYVRVRRVVGYPVKDAAAAIRAGATKDPDLWVRKLGAEARRVLRAR